MKKFTVYLIIAVSLFVVMMVVYGVIHNMRNAIEVDYTPTFIEQVLQQHHSIELAVDDARDGNINEYTIKRLSDNIEWIKTCKPSDEREEIMLYMIIQEGKSASMYLNALAHGNKNEANNNLILYVLAKTKLDELLGLSEQ